MKIKSAVLKLLLAAVCAVMAAGAEAAAAAASTTAATKIVKKMSLAEARAQIAAAIADPTLMKSLVSALDAADQVKFVAEVNAAIATMPGSDDDRSAAYLNACRAALAGAAEGNATPILAEIFATVPPTALVLINEAVADEVFSRKLEGNKNLTDAQFVEIAGGVMKAIIERSKDLENAGQVDGFAALMFTRAADGKPADITAQMTALIGDVKVKAQADKEWIPAAITGDYDPILNLEKFKSKLTEDYHWVRVPPELQSQVFMDAFYSGKIIKGGFDSVPTSAPWGSTEAVAVDTATQAKSDPVEPTPTPEPEPGPYNGQNTGK